MTGELPRSPEDPRLRGPGVEVEEDREHPEHQQHREQSDRSRSRRGRRSSHRSSSRSASSSESTPPRRRRRHSRSHHRSTSPTPDRRRSPSPISPIEGLSTEQLRSELAQRLGSVGLPQCSVAGGEGYPIQCATQGQGKAEAFCEEKYSPPPVRPWWHTQVQS